jgi:acid phosphatase
MQHIRIRSIVTCSIAVIIAVALAIPGSLGHAVTRAPAFERIFVIVLENQDYVDVQANPYFAQLASRGQLLTNYWAITHPSQPNYVAMIFGDTMSITNSDVTDIPGRNLVDQLEENGFTWKTYQEDYPGNCYTPKYESDLHLYGRKHNPFISADTVRTDPERCARIVPANVLTDDLAAGTLPDFSFYAPNALHNSHNTDIPTAAAWLSAFLEPKLKDPTFMDRMLVVIVWDEGGGVAPEPSQVSAILLGNSVRPGSVDARRYDHYSLLRTIQQQWNLGTLNRRDKNAALIRIFQQVIYLPTAGAVQSMRATPTPQRSR